MVMIINGEIVQDNDPRAIAKRGGGAGAPKTNNFGNGPRIVGINSPSTQQQQQQQQPGRGPVQGEDADGMLSPLSKLIGIEGRRIQIPPISALKFRGYSFPMIHALVSALVAMLTGDVRYALACLLALAILNPK